jgi:hypothetical protein
MSLDFGVRVGHFVVDSAGKARIHAVWTRAALGVSTFHTTRTFHTDPLNKTLQMRMVDGIHSGPIAYRMVQYRLHTPSGKACVALMITRLRH